MVRYGTVQPFLTSEFATLMLPKIPVLKREEIEPRLYITELPVQDIWLVLPREEWGAFESRNQ
jgi:hypothetical protein